jgi:YfiH family protein
MIRKKSGEMEWLEFEIFADIPGLVHGTFLRHGGVSEGPYGSLNAGGGTKDDENNITENRRRIRNALNIEHTVGAYQVHGDGVERIWEGNQEVGECDGLITDKSRIGLMIKHADCQAAIFYDPVHKALANVHCGWRGNVKNIYRRAVQKMAHTFGTKPQDLLVGISPSLGPEHSEFINYRTELPEEFWGFQVRPHYFDLWAIARHQLEQCGVQSSHIEIAGVCTWENAQDYFSYRRDKISGRHATVAMLL